MLITLVDDSVPFNGASVAAEPLGGPEKAFAALAAAIAKRGHVVRALSRTAVAAAIDNVSWLPLDGRKPAITEVLIAFRRAQLLDVMPATKRKILWLTRPAEALTRLPAAPIIARTEPHLVFVSNAQRATYSGDPPGLARVCPFGVGAIYLMAGEMEPANPPTALATTHPSHGLDWLLELWAAKIEPQIRGAELHVYSGSLAAAERGHEPPEALRAIYARAHALHDQGVRILEPLADSGMVEAYRRARAHLYPSAESEMHCSTLAESQAAGLPAVARPLGAAKDRLLDQETGFLASEEAAFAAHAVELLTDDARFAKMSREARLRQRGRSWEKVAGEFEVLFR